MTPSNPQSAQPDRGFSSLEQIGVALRSEVPSPAKFQVLNTRLIIQTGVNLKAIAYNQNDDFALIQRVCEALVRMGIQLGPNQ